MRTLIVLLSSLLLSACGTVGVPVAIEPVPTQAARPISDPTAARTLQIQAIGIAMPHGEKIGALQTGLFCGGTDDLVYTGPGALVSRVSYARALFEELMSARFPVVSDPVAMFDPSASPEGDLKIAGIVAKVKGNMCVVPPVFTRGSTKGEAFYVVRWLVFDTAKKQIVYETSTEGTAVWSSWSNELPEKLFEQAFRNAVSNLLADEGFRALVLTKSEPPSQHLRS